MPRAWWGGRCPRLHPDPKPGKGIDASRIGRFLFDRTRAGALAGESLRGLNRWSLRSHSLRVSSALSESAVRPSGAKAD